MHLAYWSSLHLDAQFADRLQRVVRPPAELELPLLRNWMELKPFGRKSYKLSTLPSASNSNICECQSFRAQDRLYAPRLAVRTAYLAVDLKLRNGCSAVVRVVHGVMKLLFALEAPAGGRALESDDGSAEWRCQSSVNKHRPRVT